MPASHAGSRWFKSSIAHILKYSTHPDAFRHQHMHRLLSHANSKHTQQPQVCRPCVRSSVRARVRLRARLSVRACPRPCVRLRASSCVPASIRALPRSCVRLRARLSVPRVPTRVRPCLRAFIRARVRAFPRPSVRSRVCACRPRPHSKITQYRETHHA